jgi:hypothetical protein
LTTDFIEPFFALRERGAEHTTKKKKGLAVSWANPPFVGEYLRGFLNVLGLPTPKAKSYHPRVPTKMA